jgi:ABC-type antimicrobial peptide transport system permease subunit
VVTLLLIGLSLLVGVLEQLRDRRRLLAVLSAVGTRRSTLGWSVLLQTAVPVTLGLLLAVPAGIGLGGVLLAMVDEPIHLDGPAIAGMAVAAAAVVLLVTAAGLPVLWRMMRADGLRTE